MENNDLPTFTLQPGEVIQSTPPVQTGSVFTTTALYDYNEANQHTFTPIEMAPLDSPTFIGTPTFGT